MRSRNTLILLMLLLGLLFAGPAWAQQKSQAAASTANDPLDFLQLLLLKVDGVSDQRLDALLTERGTDFHPNQKALDFLRKLGVTETVLKAWSAAPVRPYAGDNRARALKESQLAQQDCRAHLRADPGNFLASIVLVFTLDALDPSGEARDILEQLEHNLRTRLERNPQNVTLRGQLSFIQELKGMPALATLAHNEAYAIGGVRTLNTAVITYSVIYNKGFPGSIKALAPPMGEGANPTANAAGLIDPALASGTRSGYVFTYSPGEKDESGRVNTYTIHADPVTPGTSGNVHYFTDQSFVIREDHDRAANKQSPYLDLTVNEQSSLPDGTAAVGKLRTLNTAAIFYSATYNKGFPESIKALAPPTNDGANPTANAAGLVDRALASGRGSGYVFTYSPGAKDAAGRINTYTINADPITPGTTGTVHFFTDQSGVIRQETEAPANEHSPVIADMAGSVRVQTSAGAEVFLDGSSRGSADAAGQIVVPEVAQAHMNCG